MTLIVRRNPDGTGEVIHRDSTSMGIDGKVKVGGIFKNTGSVRVGKGGELFVDKDFLNSGKLNIADEASTRAIILEALKTTKSTADFGTQVLKTLGILN